MNDTNGQYSRIEKATTVNGNIISETDLRIDGVMEGTVTTKGKVIIGKKRLGRVKGLAKVAEALAARGLYELHAAPGEPIDETVFELLDSKQPNQNE